MLQQLKVFTLQSIKSRIETHPRRPIRQILWLFLLYSPLNQGLKPMENPDGYNEVYVFTLQSIKSRIETICTNIAHIFLH